MRSPPYDSPIPCFCAMRKDVFVHDILSKRFLDTFRGAKYTI
jgi:hypothetical protein